MTSQALGMVRRIDEFRKSYAYQLLNNKKAVENQSTVACVVFLIAQRLRYCLSSSTFPVFGNRNARKSRFRQSTLPTVWVFFLPFSNDIPLLGRPSVEYLPSSKAILGAFSGTLRYFARTSISLVRLSGILVRSLTYRFSCISRQLLYCGVASALAYIITEMIIFINR